MRFYELLSRYYDELFPATEDEMDFLSDILGGWGCKSLADVGCGTGLHSLGLARRGFRVTGLDLEPGMIRAAKDRVAGSDMSEGERLSFAVGDMLELPLGNGSVDACVCIGNSLAHLPDAGVVTSALREFGRVAGPRGLTIIQVVNYGRVIAAGTLELPTLAINKAGEEVTFRRRYEDRGSGRAAFVSSLEVSAEGRVPISEANELGMLTLTMDLLTECAAGAGMGVTEVYGNFKRDGYGVDSPSLIACIQAVGLDGVDNP